MFHGVIHKITLAQFFFETRCSHLVYQGVKWKVVYSVDQCTFGKCNINLIKAINEVLITKITMCDLYIECIKMPLFF